MGRRFTFLESFDGGNVEGGYHNATGAAFVNATPAVFGKSGSCGDDLNTALHLPPGSTDPSMVTGAYVYIPSAGQISLGVMWLVVASGGYHLWCWLDDTNGDFVFGDANQTEFARCDAIYDEWFTFEVGYTISATVGEMYCYINGALAASGTNLDLYGAGPVYTSNIRWGGSGANDINLVYLDNVYVADTNNTGVFEYLTEWNIEALHPVGTGAASDWVGTDGNSVDNYLLVFDDTDPTDVTNRLISSTDGDIDLFTLGDLTDPSVTPLAVAVTGLLYGWGGTDRDVSEVLRVGSTNYFGTSKQCISTWDGHHHIWETNPAGGDWSGSDIDSLQAGYRSDGVTATEALLGHVVVQVLHQAAGASFAGWGGEPLATVKNALGVSSGGELLAVLQAQGATSGEVVGALNELNGTSGVEFEKALRTYLGL